MARLKNFNDGPKEIPPRPPRLPPRGPCFSNRQLQQEDTLRRVKVTTIFLFALSLSTIILAIVIPTKGTGLQDASISCNVMTSSGGLETILGIENPVFTHLSFGGAKAIDVAWNFTFGQLGRLLFAYISCRVFDDALTRLMEASDTPYDLYVAVKLSPISLSSIIIYAKMFQRMEGLWRRSLAVFLLLSTVCVFLWPTLVSATFGYIGPSKEVVSAENGKAYIDLAQSPTSTCWLLPRGDLVGLSRNATVAIPSEIVANYSSLGPYSLNWTSPLFSPVWNKNASTWVDRWNVPIPDSVMLYANITAYYNYTSGDIISPYPRDPQGLPNQFNVTPSGPHIVPYWINGIPVNVTLFNLIPFNSTLFNATSFNAIRCNVDQSGDISYNTAQLDTTTLFNATRLNTTSENVNLFNATSFNATPGDVYPFNVTLYDFTPFNVAPFNVASYEVIQVGDTTYCISLFDNSQLDDTSLSDNPLDEIQYDETQIDADEASDISYLTVLLRRCSNDSMIDWTPEWGSEMNPEPNPPSLYCVQEDGYVWGYAWTVLVILVSLFLSWSCATFCVWNYANKDCEFNLRGWSRRGEYRAIADLAEALIDDIGGNSCSYSNSDVRKSLSSLGLRYYQQQSEEQPGLTHVGLSSHKRGKIHLGQDKLWGGLSMPSNLSRRRTRDPELEQSFPF